MKSILENALDYHFENLSPFFKEQLFLSIIDNPDAIEITHEVGYNKRLGRSRETIEWLYRTDIPRTNLYNFQRFIVRRGVPAEDLEECLGHVIPILNKKIPTSQHYRWDEYEEIKDPLGWLFLYIQHGRNLIQDWADQNNKPWANTYRKHEMF